MDDLTEYFSYCFKINIILNYLSDLSTVPKLWLKILG